jgi:hypothetical protein
MIEVIDKIDNYLRMGGMFNPEEIEHHKVNDLLLECRNELQRLVEKCDKQTMVLRRIYVEQFPNQWFVCGELGPRDENGLPAKIEVCPAYGVDWSQIYERTDHTIGGMGS